MPIQTKNDSVTPVYIVNLTVESFVRNDEVDTYFDILMLILTHFHFSIT